MMGDDKAMRERLRNFFDLVPSGELASGFAESDLLAFAASERALEREEVLQVPARLSGTSRAIDDLRERVPGDESTFLVLAELDRLYAQSAKKREEHAALLARASEGAAPEFAAFERWLSDNNGKVTLGGHVAAALAELDRRAVVIAAQAAELEELRARLSQSEERVAIAEHNARISNEAACIAASLKLKETAQSHPQSADRATRAVWWVCRDLAEATEWTRRWPGPAHGFDSPAEAALLIASHPSHKNDHVFKITITVERAEGSE